ncbi:hypothetical protein KVV02_002809 [Mortierella alpina]|uniref:Integrase zinc-binding domain-containing protein n=1 Tax=Mortierella alpina TaxID=64518 RepID=A0A9P7ZYE0_MORAP|nr:hypothetical protein KVV02_002809 [Mortierella alpina]
MAPSSLSASTTSTSCVSATSTTGLYLPQTYSFLTPETFETLVEGYISQLHIRKRNKALISQQLANDCLMVLTNPENTAIFNPKFRWWVRKHFVFTVVGELRILMDKKNGKPVCVREQLYDKVCYFHHIIGHGGRDKTFAAITKSYSKVPAELVSLFTKNCQTCLGHQPTYPAHETSSSSSSQLDQDEDPSPLLNSTQMFQKQIQQEHYQYQQQQHQQQQHPRSFLEESLLATHLTASTSSAHSAVPSMSHCAEMCSAETLSSIPTPMSCSSSSPLTSMLESHGHHPHPNHHDLDQSDAADLDLDQNHGLQQQQQHQQQQHQQHHQDLMAMEQQYRELAAVSKHELQGLHHALQPRQDDDDDDEAEGDDNNKEETISMEKCQLISAVADLVAQI